MIPSINLEHLWHNHKPRIFLRFNYNTELTKQVKLLKTVTWSQGQKAWHVAYASNVEAELIAYFKKNGTPITCLNTYSDEITPLPKKINGASQQLNPLPITTLNKINSYRQWLTAKRYSHNTINTYLDALTIFFKYFAHIAVGDITNDNVIEFNNDYILKNKYSASFQNQVVNAIKLFYKTVEEKTISPELIHRPKTSKLLPNVLSKQEVKLILNAHINLKHKAMLSLIYSCGLRCSELLNLKPQHIDSNRGVLIIKQAKGRKDRIAPLSDKIIIMLREYYLACKPKIYLFEGQSEGEPYDSRSLQKVLKQALEKVKINKPVSLHWLRHSYATHLLENGTDLRYIQEILGHSSSRTTEIYTHVSTKNIQKIISPFDYL